VLLKVSLLIGLFGAVTAGYVLWRRPPRRLEGGRLDLGGLGVAGPAIVQFTTRYCAPCKAAVPHLTRAARESQVAFAQVDVGARPDVARTYGIRTVPTIAVANRDGRVLGVWTALPPNGEIVEAAFRARG
jgi:thiol-disulfide isomerase/thioredoxin